jgi:hypothetical protein
MAHAIENLFLPSISAAVTASAACIGFDVPGTADHFDKSLPRVA